MAQSNRERLAALPNTILFIVQHLHKIFLIMDCLLAAWLPYTSPPAELRTSRDRRLASRDFFIVLLITSFFLMTSAAIETAALERGRDSRFIFESAFLSNFNKGSSRSRDARHYVFRRCIKDSVAFQVFSPSVIYVMN